MTTVQPSRLAPRPPTPEQVKRWFMRTCVRCGRYGWAGARWPEGPLCRTCASRALDQHGRCAGCGIVRMVPGLAADGGRLCTDCAGIPGDFRCRRCHTEGRRSQRGLCARCVLVEQLHELLDEHSTNGADDGKGASRIRPELVPLFDALRTMPRPASGLSWLRNPQVQQLLRGLAGGDVALTHEAFRRFPNWRTAAYLRELLMHYGGLPAIDKHLLLFEGWLDRRLATVDHADHARQLHSFATWHLLRRLRSRAEHAPLGAAPTNEARQQVNQATAFLAWLANRDRDLVGCTQADLDAWHGERFATRRPAQVFLRWAMTTGRMPMLALPRRSTSNPAPVTQHRRLALIRRLLTDARLALRVRVAGLLVLCYAQPASRIVRLTIDDMQTRDGQVLLRLVRLGERAEPAVPVPAPFAALLLAAAEHRPNSATAANAATRWLFPGRRTGQAMQPRTLAALLRAQGIPVQHGRTAAIRQLVLQAPAPVVASMLGYHDKTTTRLVTEAAGTWRRYAAGDHRRTSLPRHGLTQGE